MESEILKDLNAEQKLPATTTEGAVLVTAGAGSGKTRMLTTRVAYIIQALGVHPSHLLAITFTNKAAGEMKARLEKMLGDIGSMWICTFHAMCSRILRQNISLLGYSKSFSIYSETEKNRVIKRVMQPLETDINAETFAWHISNAKNNLMSPEKYSNFIHDPKKCRIITKVYSEYEAELKRANALDFDDLLVKTYELFKNYPDVLEYYQDKFYYIFVDEFQDTNMAQYELVKMLAEKHKNILAVGDEDQCIYSWRGAEVENVKRFIKDFSGAKVFKLEQNYRSTKNIISLANKLIKHNNNRIDKNLWTENDTGDEVELFECYNDIEEAERVATKIEELVERGAKYSDFAILMRVNSLSRILEEKMLTYNIPYKIYGGFKFFERKEIKDTVAYLQLIVNPNDLEAATRALQFPKKGIGDVSIEKLLLAAKKTNVSIMEIVLNPNDFDIDHTIIKKLSKFSEQFKKIKALSEAMPIEEFVPKMIEELGLKEAIGNKTEDDINKCMNIDDFSKSVAEYAEANEGATIEEFLQSITLMQDIDKLNTEDNFVTLLTVHAAKGLEFENVFVVGLNDGLFPLSRAINSADPNELEEERRLLYVAMTRAKKKLFLSRPKIKFNFETRRTDYAITSRFLTEIFDLKKNLNAPKTSMIERGFDENFANFLNSNQKKEQLDRFVSSHANVVSQGQEKVNQSNLSSQKIQIKDYSKFKTGKKVYHKHFGKGEITLGVTDFASGFVTIKFESVGIKTLSLKYADLEIIE